MLNVRSPPPPPYIFVFLNLLRSLLLLSFTLFIPKLPIALVSKMHPNLPFKSLNAISLKLLGIHHAIMEFKSLGLIWLRPRLSNPLSPIKAFTLKNLNAFCFLLKN